VIRKLSVFAHSSPFDLVTLVSTAACWYAAGLLLSAVTAGMPSLWFPVTLLAIPLQFFIVDRQPTQSMLLGAICGAALFCVAHRRAKPSGIEAWAFLAVIVLRGLSPFRFVPQATPFEWIPFGATLSSEWQSAAAILIEKAFYYGTAIWLLRTVGMSWMRAAIMATGVLGAIEIVQIHLPGRTPETTDPMLALLLGFALSMLSRSVAFTLRAGIV
jgi:hypothetical protein